MEKCDMCGKDGRLVRQEVMAANPRAGFDSPWVFRYRLCSWHKGWWNRRKMSGQKTLSYAEFLPDKELLSSFNPQT